jgi:hypothetical protein
LARSGLLASALVLITLMASPSAFAQFFNVTHGYAGAEFGDWSQGGTVTGPADDSCVNMGAVGKENNVYNFGFSIPLDAEITEVRAYTKAGSNAGQTVGVQLASDASVIPPVTLGNLVPYPFPDVGAGNCASTVVSNVGNGLGFWGLGSLDPATVNSPDFGMIFIKQETSSIKVDSICMQISYDTDEGPVTAEGCFSAGFTVNKTYDDSNTDPVSVSLTCSDGSVLPPSALAAPGSPAIFSVNDYDPEGTPTCTATEVVPPGYAGDESDCVGVDLLADGTCTIANSLISATFEVYKDFSDDNASLVPMTLTCTSGVVSPPTDNASEAGPAVFTVTGFDPGATCTATEVPIPGYVGDDTDCQDGDLIVSGETSQCTITNTLRSDNFTVSKTYDDGNTDPVSVSLTCDNGTVTASPLPAAPGAPAVFTVTGHLGDPNCTATEVVPDGYIGDESDCVDVALVSDGACTINNLVRSGQFVVQKTYDDGSTDPVSVSLTCSDGTVTTSPLDAAPGAPAIFEVTGYEGDPNCTATEVVPAGYDGDESDCVDVALIADGTCTIANSLRTAGFTVTKDYSDGNTDPVSVSLTCSDGAVTASPLDAAPGAPALFEVTGYDGDPTCTATEDLPAGYDGDESDCVDVALVADGACTIVNTLRSADFTVNKEYNDGNTDPVSVSLTCSDGTVTASPLDAAPGSPAIFTVTGYDATPTCTATEDVPSGYDGDASNCENVDLLEPGSCTITNTLRVAEFTVNKEYTDDNTSPVEVSLACTSGIVTDSPLDAAPGDPAVFEVTGYDGDPTCSAVEFVPEGYEADLSDCTSVALEADGECTIVNTPIASASFFTTKDFSDDNPAGVTAMISCNTGLPLEQDFEIFDEPGGHVNFIVTDFESGIMDCVITELEVPDGYSVTYVAGLGPDGEAGDYYGGPDGCFFEDIVTGAFTCEIKNDANPATYTVVKDWAVFQDGGDVVIPVADVTIECDSEILDDGAWEDDGTWYLSDDLGDGDSLTAHVDVTEEPATCSATEDIDQSGVESVELGCSGTTLSAGGSHTCVFTNTVFFEGIPTLNQYGLALLVLLTLGVGFVGLRRFV